MTSLLLLPGVCFEKVFSDSYLEMETQRDVGWCLSSVIFVDSEEMQSVYRRIIG
jgi:hypothetical protein